MVARTLAHLRHLYTGNADGDPPVQYWSTHPLFPYLYEPIDVEQVPTAHIADPSPPAEVLSHVRHRGDPHAGLSTWHGHDSTAPLLDPPVDRP